jgi:hypothetical protein
MKNHILEGKTILDIKIANDKQAIKFITDQGEIVAKCDADCCSHTWIESVELPCAFPALVNSIENLHLRDDEEIDGETIRFYGCKISTNKGDIIIDYRNSSNGYYGGSLSWPDEPDEEDYFYGGVFGQNISSQQWVDIKE